MNSQITEAVESAARQVPETYFDQRNNTYLVRDGNGELMPQSESQVARRLRLAGYFSKIARGATASEIDVEIAKIQNERNVHYTGALAGYSEGIQVFNGKRLLVTRAPAIITPVEGTWETLRILFEGVLGDEQAVYFYGWLRVAYDALRAQAPRAGQAAGFCGPADCGKSLIQNLITPILGNRSAKPYSGMTGGTTFNSDWFEAEHLMIEDEVATTDIRSRRNFGNFIKMITVNEDQRLHAKHRDAICGINVLWRLSISVNDEPENILVFPPLDESIRDKLMLFHVKRPRSGFDTSTAEKRTAYWRTLEGELPAFLWWLTNSFEIPSRLECSRFGIKGYLNPTIVGLLTEQSPEVQLMQLIDTNYFSPARLVGPVTSQQQTATLELSAHEITSSLTSSDSPVAHEARRLFSWNGACGVYLKRLSTLYPERFKHKRSAQCRKWLITPPEDRESPTEACQIPDTLH